MRVYARTYVCVWERIHDRPVEARCFHNKSVLAIARHVTNAPFQVVLCPQLHLPHLWLEFIEHLHMHPYTCLCSHVRMRHTYHVTRAQHVLSDFTLIAACKRYTWPGQHCLGRAASRGALAPEPPRAHWSGTEQGSTVERGECHRGIILIILKGECHDITRHHMTSHDINDTPLVLGAPSC